MAETIPDWAPGGAANSAAAGESVPDWATAKPLTTTATGAFARGAATGVVPAFAAAGGAAGGAEAGLAIGAAIPVLGETGIGEIGGALIGALVGGLLGDKAQKEVIKAASPETYNTLQQYQQQDLKDHPVAAAVGNLASSLPAFRLGDPVTAAKGAAAIYKIARGEAVTTAEKQLAKNVATQVGLGAAGGVAAPLIQGQKPTAGELTQSIAQTLLFGTPRFGGKVSPNTVDVRKSTTESEDQNAKGIRENQGQPGTPGQVAQGGEANRGSDVQQTSPGPSQPVGAREEGAQPGSPRGTDSQEGHGTLTPALLVDGKPVTGGPTHAAIFHNNLANASAEDAGKLFDALADDSKHVFVDAQGNVLDRKQAQKVFEDAGGKVSKPELGLQSEDLIAAARAKLNAVPVLPPGEKMVTIQRPDGSTYQAASSGKTWDIKGEKVPDVGVPTATGEWSHGPLQEGEKIVGSVGAAEAGSDEFSGGNPDVQGVRQITRESQAKAGLPVVAQPGKGTTPDEQIQLGRTILGKDPTAADRAYTEFYAETDPAKRKISESDFAASRAKYDMVQAHGREIEEQFGTDSPEYEAAKNETYKWSRATKDMGTVWGRVGVGQQGVRDIDTGSVIGLETEYHDQTGKDFTPEQRGQATEKTGKVKTATAETDAAQTQFNGELAKEAVKQTMTPAEKAALDAAHKTVREAAARMATAENKARAANQELRTAAQNVQPKAAAKAQAAADKTVREAAARQAKAVTKQRVQAQIAKAKAAQVQLKAAQAAHQAAIDRVRQMASDAAKKASDERVHPEIKAWQKVKDYLDQGMHNFDDIRNRVATDLGLPVKKVTELLTQRKRLKLLADDVWRKQEQLRLFKQQANRWLMETQMAPIAKALAKIPRGLFKLKVGGHGFVALGTHAPMVGFQPQYWGTYLKDFGTMYRMVGNTAFHEMQMQDLIRRPNYIVGRRAGLVTDPNQYEEYNSPRTNTWANAFFGAGNRGYSVLKILRQDMFDQHWDNLPQSAKTPETAQALADAINHATGVIKARVFPKASLALFAPRLLASRGAWLVTDPIKAVTTFSNWKNASEADRMFAIHQAKEKAWVMGTMISLLALNQAVLAATGSKQKVNLDDPFKSDWMKFKVAGMNFSYGNQFLTMARLPVQLLKIREQGTGKLKNLIYPDESMYSLTGKYIRSQLSPFASLAADILTRGDWQERPLPGSPSPVPKRLAQQGVKPYTWPEFFSEEFAPIPFEEAVREVWHDGFHWDENGVKTASKALATLIVMGGTGARLTDDIPDRSTQPPTYPPQWFNPPQGQTNVLNESHP